MKISLCLHIEKNKDISYEQAHAEFIELCQIADEAGFHAIWTGEHHAMDFAITPNPLLSLIDIAHHTKSVRLGTATVIAPFWHPIRLAGEIAYTDMVTRGRLEVGVSKGAFQYEYDRFHPNMDAQIASEMMRESIEAIEQLWKGNYAHNGAYWQFPETSIAPKPAQHPCPPIWIAAQSPLTVNYAIKHNYNVQMTPLWFGEEKVEECFSIYKDAKKNNPEKQSKMLLLRHAYITHSEEHKTQILENFSHFYSEFLAWFNQSQPISNGQLVGEFEINDMFKIDALEKNLLVGSSAEIIETLNHYKANGLDEFALWLANGMSHEEKKALLHDFIQDVLPHVR